MTYAIVAGRPHNIDILQNIYDIIIHGISQYPTWMQYTRPLSSEATGLDKDIYYVTQYDGETYIVNTEIGHDHNRIYLLPVREGRMTFSSPIWHQLFEDKKSMLTKRDWIFSNLPAALMMGALQ